MTTLTPSFLIGSSNEDNHKSSDGFEIRQDPTMDLAALEHLEKSP